MMVIRHPEPQCVDRSHPVIKRTPASPSADIISEHSKQSLTHEINPAETNNKAFLILNEWHLRRIGSRDKCLKAWESEAPVRAGSIILSLINITAQINF
jgi:hypothetical protein